MSRHTRRTPPILTLPPELHLLIALHLYSPLHLTQQDRLTWSVFSTVDMDPDRWAGMDALIAFAGTCRAVRCAVRYLLFRCVRVHGLREGRWLIRASTNKRSADNGGGGKEKARRAATGDDWGQYVHSVILDMAMFDPDQQQVQLEDEGRANGRGAEYDDEDESRRAVYTRVARWTTSVQTQMAMPPTQSAATISDTVDDHAERPPDLMPDDAMRHASPSPIPPPVEKDATTAQVSVNGTTCVEPLSMQAASESDGNSASEDDEEDWESFPLTPPRVRDPWKEASFLITMLTRLPSLHHLSIFADPSDDLTLSLLFSHPAMLAIAPRLRSFGWRLRASPPSALREFDNSTMYVSIQGWLRECTRLGFLVLDSDIEKEGVREVDLERVVACLGEGRQRTIRQREREARRGKRQSRVSRQDSARMGDVGVAGKRKYEDDGQGGHGESGKRPRVESTASNQLVHRPISRSDAGPSTLQSPGQEADASTPSKLSLMLCGPIQGWMLSHEAEIWAAENMDDLRAWMMETKAKVSMDDINGTSDCSGTMGQGRGLQGHPYVRRDEPTPGPEIGGAPNHNNGHRAFRESIHTGNAAPGPLLSPVSVLSSSYSPVVSMGGANGPNAYFHHHHHDHFAQHDSDGIQPYIHQIASTPYQPHYAGIVPSYTSNVPAPSPTAVGYPVRPALRSHSRSHTPLSAAERRRAALENRPPVFLDGMIMQFAGIKELFVDRPVRAPYGSEEDTLRFLSVALIPLIHLPDLTLLQIGGYPLSDHNQLIATELVVNLCPKILLCGWLGLEGETNWYGVWRDRGRKVHVEDYWGRGLVERYAYGLKPMGDGDLFDLEEEQQAVAV